MAVNVNEILKLTYSKDGSPWARVASKSGIILDTLEYSKDGSPWWGIAIVSEGGLPLKYYTGSVWRAGVLKYYTGSSWITKSLKIVT